MRSAPPNNVRLRRLLSAVCTAPRQPLRALALSMVSHATLLRPPGPLGMWAPTQAERLARQQANHVQRQTAIIVSGLMLGFVVKTANGFEVIP